MEAGCAGTKRDALYLHAAIGDDTHHENSELVLYFVGQFTDGRFRNREEIRIRGVLIFFPAERTNFSRENSVARVAVPVVVESPDDQVMGLEELALPRRHRIAPAHRQ